MFDESSDFVFKKYIAAVDQKLVPIICVGEKSEERTKWKEVLEGQLEKYLKGLKSNAQVIFAYEPLWSIGTGVVPTMKDIEKVTTFIKDYLCKKVDYPVLYGGSVAPENAGEILKCEGVDGVLVGGASLVLDKFVKIIEAA